MNKRHIIMIIAIILIVVLPLMLFQGKGEDEGYFGGADGVAADAITESGYEPWFEPLWEPPSGELESLLFATQAAIGAGIIGYFLGYYQMKRKMESK
ncbi:MAG: energy-coupling factor ABC transporter substrate-binding protein [Methanobacteriaceae archaeon]|nr:energy-coupling factor ABC transporter substrate-binding protein [Methanobacteriaceae archaeon]